MRKRFPAILACILISFSVAEKENFHIPTDLELLLIAFEKAVASHDTVAVLSLLDSGYKTHELETYLRGDTENFLNNFFCGQVLGTDQFHCLIFGEISRIKRVSLKKKKEKIVAKYRVVTAEKEIETELEVAAQVAITYGMVGSNGPTQLGGM